MPQGTTIIYFYKLVTYKGEYTYMHIQLNIYKFVTNDKVMAYSPDLGVAKLCPADAGSFELANLFLDEVKAGRLVNKPVGWYIARRRTIKWLTEHGYDAEKITEELTIEYNYGSET